MTFNFKTGNVSVYPSGEVALLLNLPREYQKDVEEINKLIESDKLKTIELKPFREKRSLTANSYMWALIGQIAEKMDIPTGDCYVKMIKDYGVYVSEGYMKKEAFEVFEPAYNKASTKVQHNSSMCDITREFKKGNTEWIEYNAFIGSSEYDKKQFSRLVDGVVEEAKLLGIQTITQTEIDKLVDDYYLIEEVLKELE